MVIPVSDVAWSAHRRCERTQPRGPRPPGVGRAGWRPGPDDGGPEDAGCQPIASRIVRYENPHPGPGQSGQQPGVGVAVRLSAPTLTSATAAPRPAGPILVRRAVVGDLQHVGPQIGPTSSASSSPCSRSRRPRPEHGHAMTGRAQHQRVVVQWSGCRSTRVGPMARSSTRRGVASSRPGSATESGRAASARPGNARLVVGRQHDHRDRPYRAPRIRCRRGRREVGEDQGRRPPAGAGSRPPPVDRDRCRRRPPHPPVRQHERVALPDVAGHDHRAGRRRRTRAGGPAPHPPRPRARRSAGAGALPVGARPRTGRR